MLRRKKKGCFTTKDGLGLILVLAYLPPYDFRNIMLASLLPGGWLLCLAALPPVQTTTHPACQPCITHSASPTPLPLPLLGPSGSPQHLYATVVTETRSVPENPEHRVSVAKGILPFFCCGVCNKMQQWTWNREMQQVPLIPVSAARKFPPSTGPGSAQPEASVPASKTSHHCQLLALH